MGNEMGNNNTSGLREEDNTNTEAQEKSFQESAHNSDVKGENYVVPTTGNKDYNQKESELASDDPKEAGEPPVYNQKSEGTEEDNTNTEAQGKSLQEPVHNNDAEGQTESKDSNQKETGLASDVPKEAGEPPVHSQTYNGTGQAETEVNPPVESAEDEKQLNEEGGKDRHIQPAVSLLTELEDDKEDHKNPTPIGTILDISNNQIEKQASFKREAEDIPSSTSVAITSEHDMDPEDSAVPNSEQHEYANVHADQQDGTDSLSGTTDVLGSSTAYNSKENGHQLDTCISENLEGITASDTNVDVERTRDELLVQEMASTEEEKPSKDELEVEVGNQDANIFSKSIMVATDHLRDIGEIYDGELASKVNSNGTNFLESKLEANMVTDSLNSHLEVLLPQDKCIILTQETELMGKESESEENKQQLPFSVPESKIDKGNASQTDSLTRITCKKIETSGCGSLITAHDAASNGNCEAEEVNVVEESNNQTEAFEENCNDSEGKIAHELGRFEARSSIANGEHDEEESGDCIPEAYAIHDTANNGNCQIEGAKVLVESDSQNECSEEHHNGTEGKHVMVRELGVIAAKLSIANGKNNEQESEDLRPEALTADDAALNGNCQVEEVKLPEESDNQKEPTGESSEGFEGNIVMNHEFGIIAAKSPLANGKINEDEPEDHIADEAYEEKIIIFPELATVAAELPVTNNEEEAEDCKAKEHVPKEKKILEMEEKTEAPCAPAEQHVSWTPASLFQFEHHQQEIVNKSEDAKDSNKPTLELKPESNSEYISTASSAFHASNCPVDSLVSANEKPVEEILPHVIEAPEMATETISSASGNHSSEHHEKIETYVFARDGFEAQENAGRVNNEPIPENLIQADTEKSPSSTVESTVSGMQLRVEKPQESLQSTVLEAVTQAKPPASVSQSSEQCKKVETSALATGGYEPQESLGRFSIESIPDNLNITAEMRKSPSFNLDLRIEAARSEESDQTPLLYQDKNAIENISNQADGKFQNSLTQAQQGQESFKYQATPMEEKVITLERSDSEKSRTPFLGFMKEDEEAQVQVVVQPKRKEDCVAAIKTTKDSWNSSSTKEISPTPPKNKAKHKRRSSLFTNCMCCTTVIN